MIVLLHQRLDNLQHGRNWSAITALASRVLSAHKTISVRAAGNDVRVVASDADDRMVLLGVAIVKRLIVCGVLIMAGAQASYADDTSDVHPSLTNKFSLDFGVFYPDRQVTIQAGSTLDGDYEFINYQGELKHATSDETFSMNFGWRFGEKWQLAAQYFDSSGSQQAVLDEDVEFNDVIFRAGSNVTSGSHFSLIRLFFARDFAIAEDQEFGVGAGLHYLELGASIQGEIITDTAETRFRRESVRVSSPLPNIGVWYAYSISPKWAIKGRFDWISASVDPFDGRLINASLGANYQMFKNVGLGLSYNYFELDVRIHDTHWKGAAETRYSGFFAFLSFNW